MARQTIQTGTVANDGTGDSLRQAAQKINENFIEMYLRLGGDSDTIVGGVTLLVNGLVIEGSTVDAFETSLIAVEPTQDNTILIPNVSGSFVLDSASQTLLNKRLDSADLRTPIIADASADHFYKVIPGELTANRSIQLPVLSGNDTFTFNNASQTLANKTLTAPVITSGKFNNILDTSGAEVIALTATGSAVNQLNATNAATGTGPTLGVSGDDTNISLNVSAKGTGTIKLNNPVSHAAETLTGSGAISLLTPLTIINAAGATSMTLANASVVGHVKKMANINTGVSTVTPTSFNNGTSFALKANGACELLWTGSGWHLMADSSDFLSIT